MYFRAALCIGFIFVSGAALAQMQGTPAPLPSLDSVGTRLISQTGSLATFLWRLIFVSGVILTMTGLWKFYSHVQNPNDPAARKNVAIVYIFAGCLMVALPSVMGTGIATFFGSGAADSAGSGLSGFRTFN